MQRPRDLWDVLQNLTYLSQPDVTATNEVLDMFATPNPDTTVCTDGVSLRNRGHSGVYYWDDPTTIWGLFQWG